MSGLIGGCARRRLEGRYQLRALNRREVVGAETHCADISDIDAIQEAFTGIDAVVHLAAKSAADATWQEVRDFNVSGTYNVFEAARRAGVKRIVYASSGSAVGGYESVDPYGTLAEGRYAELPESWPMVRHDAPVWPSNLYACSKIWGEALARYYSDGFGISIICLRFGQVTEDDRPSKPRQYAIWTSQRDAAQMIERSLRAPDSVRFDTFFVTSRNKYGYRDLSHGRDVLGFDPQDDAEDYRSK